MATTLAGGLGGDGSWCRVYSKTMVSNRGMAGWREGEAREKAAKRGQKSGNCMKKPRRGSVEALLSSGTAPIPRLRTSCSLYLY